MTCGPHPLTQQVNRDQPAMLAKLLSKPSKSLFAPFLKTEEALYPVFQLRDVIHTSARDKGGKMDLFLLTIPT
jgi:hypothetical protein